MRLKKPFPIIFLKLDRIEFCLYFPDKVFDSD